MRVVETDADRFDSKLASKLVGHQKLACSCTQAKKHLDAITDSNSHCITLIVVILMVVILMMAILLMVILISMIVQSRGIEM